MSPAHAAALDFDTDAVPFSARLAEKHMGARLRTMDRRAHPRLPAHALEWLRGARLRHGPDVTLVDLSVGGALLEADVQLRPGSLLTLEIDGTVLNAAVQLEVLRCQVARLRDATATYRGACAFRTPLDLAAFVSQKPDRRDDFIGFDEALARLIGRAGGAGPALDSQSLLQVLEALQARARRAAGDRVGARFAEILADIMPGLRQGAPPSRLAASVEHLARVAAAEASAGERDAQLAALGGKLLVLVQRVDAVIGAVDPSASTVAAIPPAGAAPATPTPDDSPRTAPPQGAAGQSSWQKIVVRYRNGELLKGYSHDFSPGRQHFSLWPSIAAARGERILIPVTRLKAVFFVRDFAGNAGYVAREVDDQKRQGRRIEVTFADNEVLRGTTLNYRPDGAGFFVIPLDPASNNLRIFVAHAAVRRVCFP